MAHDLSNALEFLRGVLTLETEKTNDRYVVENERKVTQILGLFWNKKNNLYQYNVELFINKIMHYQNVTCQLHLLIG